MTKSTGIRAYQNGRRLAEAGDNAAAIRQFDSAIAANPGFVDARISKAIALGELDRPDLAVSELRRAIELAPDNALAHYNLGLFLKQIEDFQAAISILHRAIELDTSDADIPWALASAYEELGAIDSAKFYYRAALERDPNSYDALIDLAWLLSDQDDHEAALVLSAAAVESAPTEGRVQYGHGSILRRDGRFSESVEFLKHAIALDPSYDCAYNNLGLAYLDLEQPREAVEAFEHGLKIAGEDPQLEVNLSNALAASGEHEKAQALMSSAAARYPDDAWVQRQYGYLLIDDDRYEEAILVFTEAIRLDPSDVEALRNLGIAYDNMARYAEARKCYRAALKLAPNDAHVLNSLGVSYSWSGRNKESTRYYRAAIAADPGAAFAHRNLALRLRDEEEFEEALREFDEAERLGYDRADLFYNRGCIYEDIGRIDLAVKNWQTAVTKGGHDEAVKLAQEALDSTVIFEGTMIVPAPENHSAEAG